jgi:hypothetical protein
MTSLSYFGYNETRTYNNLLQLTRRTVPNIFDTEYVFPTGANNGQISASIAVAVEHRQTAPDYIRCRRRGIGHEFEFPDPSHNRSARPRDWAAGKAASFYKSMPLPELFGAVAALSVSAAVVMVLLIKPTVRLMAGVK